MDSLVCVLLLFSHFLIFPLSLKTESRLLMNILYVLVLLSVSIWEELPTILFILHLELKKKIKKSNRHCLYSCLFCLLVSFFLHVSAYWHIQFQVISTSELQNTDGDRGQASLDWLASFKKAFTCLLHWLQGFHDGWPFSIRSQYGAISFELNMDKRKDLIVLIHS